MILIRHAAFYHTPFTAPCCFDASAPWLYCFSLPFAAFAMLPPLLIFSCCATVATVAALIFRLIFSLFFFAIDCHYAAVLPLPTAEKYQTQNKPSTLLRHVSLRYACCFACLLRQRHDTIFHFHFRFSCYVIDAADAMMLFRCCRHFFHSHATPTPPRHY